MGKHSASLACPCGSGLSLQACCGRWHAGEAAPSAEALMRSRYCAYVLGLEDYLLATWHLDTRPAALHLDEAPIKWLGLKVLGAKVSGDTATVHFVARYKVRGRAAFIDENSRFVCEHGCWFYVDGLLS